MGIKLKRLGAIFFGFIIFWGVKTLVQTAMMDDEPSFVSRSEFIAEADESGIDADAASYVYDKALAGVEDSETARAIKEAYGPLNASSYKEIRAHLNSNPLIKSKVAQLMVQISEKYIEFPVRLDEYTTYTGVHYSPAESAMVYDYTLSDDFLIMVDGDYEFLKSELEALNPDAVCKSSLSFLAQGFDMIYSYLNSSAEELFRIVRTYEGCELLGFRADS
jgi:hypothetical protein